MDPVGLLTVLGLVVAVWALLPDERRLDFRLRLSWWDRSIVVLALVVVHVLSYQSVWDQLGGPALFGPWKWGFNAENTSYLILLAATVYVWWRSRSAGLRSSKITLFREQAERLLYERKYTQLVFVLEAHFAALVRAYEGDHMLPRLRRFLLAAPMPGLTIDASGNLDVVATRPRLWRRLIAPLARPLPTGEDREDAAHDVLRRVLLSRDFVEEIVRVRPYFALDVLRHEFREQWDFVELLVRSLLRNTSSALYFEIENNQNVRSDHRYYLKAQNRFIHFFLADARVAEKLRVYYAFVNFALEELTRLSQDPESDRYRKPLQGYREHEQWRSPLFCVIRWYDIMVAEALHQGIEWHVSLYRLPEITEKILSNLAGRDESRDEHSEWKTPYHYILYEIIRCISAWTESLRFIPPGQKNVTLASENLDHENSNVAKSALLVLGEVFRRVIPSPSVDDWFKAYLLRIALETLRELSGRPATLPFARVMTAALAQGGVFPISNRTEYHKSLRAVLLKVDHVLRMSEGPNQLCKALGIDPLTTG